MCNSKGYYACAPYKAQLDVRNMEGRDDGPEGDLKQGYTNSRGSILYSAVNAAHSDTALASSKVLERPATNGRGVEAGRATQYSDT